jgi:hypothetical protein
MKKHKTIMARGMIHHLYKKGNWASRNFSTTSWGCLRVLKSETSHCPHLEKNHPVADIFWKWKITRRLEDAKN